MEGVDLSAEVRRIVSKLETVNPDLSATARVQRAWNNIADAGALKHTDAVYVVPETDASEVVVFVDAQIWATDLNLQSELLRLRLNLEIDRLLEREGKRRARNYDDALFGYEQAEYVKKLQFVPSKEKYASRKKTVEEEISFESENDVSEPVSLNEEEEAELRRGVASIEDDKLREAAYRAARAHLELLKGKNN